MKRLVILLAVIASAVTLTFAVPAFAARPVSHEIVVSADGDGDFTTVQAAFDSITDAADTNRYVVRVKPGTYAESVAMKDYVDLRGSGKNNTIIIGNTPSPAGGPACWVQGAVPTVLIANSTSISDIKIINKSSDAGGNGIGIKADNVSIRIENVIVESSGVGPYGANTAICTNGSLSHQIVINNVEAKAVGGLDNIGIELSGGTTAINNTYAEASTGQWAAALYGGYGGVADVRNSEFVSYDAGYVSAIQDFDSRITVTGTKAIASDGLTKSLALWSFSGTMTNSEIYASSSQGGVYAISGNSGSIAASLIDGAIQNFTNGKIVNCWDASFNPIPNQ